MARNFILRVQTDGSITPRTAVIQACKDLITDLNTLSREFTKEWELRKMVSSQDKDAVDGFNDDGAGGVSYGAGGASDDMNGLGE